MECALLLRSVTSIHVVSYEKLPMSQVGGVGCIRVVIQDHAATNLGGLLEVPSVPSNGLIAAACCGQYEV